MELYYMTVDTYSELLGFITTEYPSLVSGFTALFETYTSSGGETYYCVPDVGAYSAWVSTNLLGGEELDEDNEAIWMNWGGTVQIKSTQGGGILPNV